MSRQFQLVTPNPDLSIHPDPMFPNVAVVCRWKDAHAFHRANGSCLSVVDGVELLAQHVAVVGPLHAPEGCEELIRNLLYNPQVTRLIVVGMDQSVDEIATRALVSIWAGDLHPALAHLEPYLVDVIRNGVQLVVHCGRFDGVYGPKEPITPRLGGEIRIEPRVPTPRAPAPPGDPGQRVVRDLLPEVYLDALHQVMSFGRVQPTHHGNTRELLNLVSVVRDPAGSRDLPEWVPESSDADRYAEQLQSAQIPDGVEYTYGSRLHYHDQVAAFEEQLGKSPDSRALFLTSWDPARDAGRESGRPCLVGVWFRRAIDGLHMTVAFRSHDLYRGYPLNLTAACRWLCVLAERHGTTPGTLTCVSMSAHIYERDWFGAETLLQRRTCKHLDLDHRSSWRVERTKEGLRAVAMDPITVEPIAVFTGVSATDLRRQIERSGLVQSVGGALWLGAELARFSAW